MEPIQRAFILFITLAITLSLVPSTRRTSAIPSLNKETPLTPGGLVYEMFRDNHGELWISDYIANEIWHINPATSAYTVYEDLYGASDGRLDSSRHLWWSNPDDGMFGRLDPDTAQATLWTLPANSSPVGITFDHNNHLWLTDQFEPILRKFTPASNELCTYTIPDGSGASDYILFHNGRIWANDWILGRILSLDPATGTITAWKLAGGAYPQGLAIDASNQLWWANNSLGELGRLNPQTNTITTYTIPGAAPAPVQLSIRDGKVWYSDENGTIGQLDPAVAISSSTTQLPATITPASACRTLAEGNSRNVATRSGTLQWSVADYPLDQNNNGWKIYQLPAGAAPYGLATNNENVWFADQGDDTDLRPQFLGWLKSTDAGGDSNIFLPLAIDN